MSDTTIDARPAGTATSVWVGASLLAISAVAVWVLASAEARDAAVPTLACLALWGYFASTPPAMNSERMPGREALRGAALGGVLWLAGLVAGSVILAAAGVCLGARAWVSSTRARGHLAARWENLLLLGVSFPWALADGQQLGSWFRITGASTSAALAHLAGFEVTLQGTRVEIEGACFDVAAGCAGLGTLQLAVGLGVALLCLDERLRARPALVLLALLPLAWLWNTTRILSLTAVALSFGNEAAMGWRHDAVGLVLLAIVGGAAWFVVRSLPEPSSNGVGA